MTTVGLQPIAPIPASDSDCWPTRTELESLFRLKFGDPYAAGWCPALMHRYGYFIPDIYYEAVVAKLVQEGQPWLDVGGGRDLFPHNRRLAELLSERSGCVVGVDPDGTLDENPFVHHKIKACIEDVHDSRTFPLVTLRMVAEHITRPQKVVDSLARLTALGGHVVVYTINLRSPLSWASLLIPFRFHHPLKRLVWKTEEKDTFPVAYKMNTRRRLKRLFASAGFQERRFDYLSDCRTFARFYPLFKLELLAWRTLKSLGLVYPENCLLGVYERV